MAQDSTSAALNESELTKLLIPKGPAKTFQQHLAKTQVSDAVLRKLETMPDPGPIILLNYVRWRPDRDPTSYMKYGKVAVTEQDKEGAWRHCQSKLA